MPNYMDYQKSIAQELASVKNRIRDFIDGNHWGEDGRYKEEILKEVLADKLPSYASVGTGFVACDGNRASSQIDIIVYDNNIPLLFKKGDFVIVAKEAVLAIVEVKTDVSRCLRGAMRKAHRNGKLIDRRIFNGIFSYDYSANLINENAVSHTLKEALVNNFGNVNHLALGENYLIKYWEDGSPNDEPRNKYRLYKIEGLAFGYFISNLIEDIHLVHCGESIPENLRNVFYPITETKEPHKIADIFSKNKSMMFDFKEVEQ